jgi:hypothetical protein
MAAQSAVCGAMRFSWPGGSEYWLAQTASYGLDAERDSTMAEHAVGEAMESEL